jgi:HAD superfamily hydrolase (TIGR01509 family)
MRLQGIIFDMDGVIAETEAEGHRVAFNRAFAIMGLDIEWDHPTYKELLKISGGKERIAYYLKTIAFNYPKGESEAEFLKRLHAKKTTVFMEMAEEGQMPALPGVKRFIDEIIESGVKLAVATSASEKACHALLRSSLGNVLYEKIDAILAGDIVKKKKPDPEIYIIVQKKLRVDPKYSFVIEDSRNGLLSAIAEGFNVCIVPSLYTKSEDFSEAQIVVDCLGEKPDFPAKLLQGDCLLENDEVTLSVLESLLSISL